MRKLSLNLRIFVFFFCFSMLFCLGRSIFFAEAKTLKPGSAKSVKPKTVRNEYLAYFEEVYKVMAEHYYVDVRRSDFDRFLKTFDEKIYKNLASEGKSSDYVRWRSAAYLVDFLKQPNDIFSRFLPKGKPTEQFQQEVYGQRQDLGIEGHLEAPGFVVDFVEPRSGSYEKGLRENDLVLRIGGKDVQALGEQRVSEELIPLIGSEI